MRHTPDPDACAHGDCPFELFSELPNLQEVYAFSVSAMSQHTERDRDGNERGVKYFLDGDSFDRACRMFGIPDDNLREAMAWASLVVKSANDATRNLRKAKR